MKFVLSFFDDIKGPTLYQRPDDVEVTDELNLAYALLPPGSQNRTTDTFFTTFHSRRYVATVHTIRSDKFKRGALTFSCALSYECYDDALFQAIPLVQAESRRVLDEFTAGGYDFNCVKLDASQPSPSNKMNELKVLPQFFQTIKLSLLCGLRVAVLTDKALEHYCNDAFVFGQCGRLGFGFQESGPAVLGLVGVTNSSEVPAGSDFSDLKISTRRFRCGALAFIVDQSVATHFDVVINQTARDVAGLVKADHYLFCQPPLVKQVRSFAKEPLVYEGIEHARSQNSAWYQQIKDGRRTGLGRETASALERFWFGQTGCCK